MGALLKKKTIAAVDRARKLTVRVSICEDMHPDAFKVLEATPNRGMSKRVTDLIAASAHAAQNTAILRALLNNVEQITESNRVLTESMEKMIAFSGDFQKTIGQVHSEQQTHLQKVADQQQAYAREVCSLLQHFRSSAYAPFGASTPLADHSTVSPDDDFSTLPPDIGEIKFS